MDKIIHYQTQAVRDLAHSCFGSSLITAPTLASDARHCHLTLNPQRQAWLRQLDTNPAALLDRISSMKSTRLGIYFEALWQFFIDSDPDLELTAANLPVRENGITRGEFDLIYFDKTTGEHYHLELAVKFYMGLAGTDTSQQDHWWGPNCKDRLDLKLKRLFEHQCAMSQSEQGIKELNLLSCSQINREMAVKGMLFYPADNQQKPQGIDAGHQRGEWFDLKQFKKLSVESRYWKLLSRSNWLSPFYQAAGETPCSHEKLIEQLECYFEINQRPLMACSLEENDKAYYEIKRYFITRDNWPGEASARAPKFR
jgi:hypothetical protein